MKNAFLIITILLSFLINSCDNKEYVESPEVTSITNGSLENWVKNAPFDNYWDPKADSDDHLVFTNQMEVFPFLGKFKNASGTLAFLTNPEYDAVYQKNTAIFKDEKWGESFAHGILLYEPTELFVDSYYSEGSNVLFSGVNNINQRHNASLAETQITVKNEDHKVALYWVASNQQQYLSGFYQKEQLAFQFAFVFTDTLSSIQKIKEINTTMNINAAEWKNLKPADLKINMEPQSFWKNPYQGLYVERFIPQLKVNIKNTSFQLASESKATSQNVDYLFIKEDQPNHKLSFHLSATNDNELDYQEKMNDQVKSTYYNEFKNEFYVTSETTTNGIVLINAQSYYKNNQLLNITYHFPEKDKNARKELEDLLTTLRISKF